MQRVHTPQRPRLTLKILLYAIVDVGGMVLLAAGVMWMAQDKVQFLPGFPANMAEAAIGVIGGVLLMFWAATRILRELTRRPPESSAEGD